jgi:protein SCO1
MEPNLLNPKQLSDGDSRGHPVKSPESTGLSRRELLGTLLLGLTIAGVAAVIALFSSQRQRAANGPSKPDHARRLVDFTLTDRTGRTVTQADLAGKILVVNFVFTSCSLSCRAVNDRMAEIQGLLGDAEDVRLVSLTVDPRTDTPSVLSKFADGFQADTNRWLFLTGNKTELYGLIETSFIAKSPELEPFIPGGFASTDRIMLVDRNRVVRGSFDGLKRGVTDAVVSEIKKLRTTPELK